MRKMKFRSTTSLSLIYLALTLLLGVSNDVYSGDKQVVGWVEEVKIFPGKLKIKAKLDTGALNSSLHAIQIDEFKRGGEDWVRFSIENRQHHPDTFEKKVIRTARIKEHDRKSGERPAIRLGICLGNVFKEVEVNLVDRGRFKYRMLLGRSFLKDSFVVDSALMFTIDPQCQRE